MSDQINSSKAPEPVGLYPHARRGIYYSSVGWDRGKEERIFLVWTWWKEYRFVRYRKSSAGRCFRMWSISWRMPDRDGIRSWMWQCISPIWDDFPIYNRLWAEYFKRTRRRTTLKSIVYLLRLALSWRLLRLFRVFAQRRKDRREGLCVLAPSREI